MTITRRSPNPNSKRYESRRAILALLEQHKLTPDELAGFVTINAHNVRHNLRALREQNLARICGYAEPNGKGMVAAIWTAGSEPDARMPSEKKRRKASWQRHYQKNKMIYRARAAAAKGEPINPFAQLMWGAQ